jgi:RNA polymerase sigma-70 factor (ECF subfamily)
MTLEQKYKLESVFITAYHQYYKSLVTRAFFKLNDRILGEDLVQATFMKAWDYLMQGQQIHMLKSFLYRILNNLIIDEYRKRKTSSLDELLEKGFEPEAEHPENIFDALDGKKVASLIEHLPKRYKDVVHMRYVEDLSLQNISDITGRSRNCVSVQAYRGLALLKKLSMGGEVAMA